MNYKKKKTRFKSLIRIDPKQKKYLYKNKDCKTMAGFLDKLINFQKKHRKLYDQWNDTIKHSSEPIVLCGIADNKQKNV